jgi:cytochrome c2
MRGLGLPVCLALIALSAAGATRNLLLGDSKRGESVFRDRQCILCHSVNGEGGRIAPDLGRVVGRGFSPYHLAGLLWNHAPAMWAVMEQRGVRKPEVSAQDAADLFAYFFAAGYFEKPGDPGRGRQVFRQAQCSVCHGIDAPQREGIRPVSQWDSLRDPIALAQQMWNHSGEMKKELERSKIPYPRLDAQQLTDLLAYLRSLPQTQGLKAEFAPAAAQTGEIVFAARGCAACHSGDHALERHTTRYTLNEFAAAMWNHSFRSTGTPKPLTYEDMRELVGYLAAMQFFEERGDVEVGRKVYQQKRCAACHDNPSSGAPPRTAMASRMTSYDMVAALWKHGPAMLKLMQQRGVTWPRFSGSEMADLTAYLHGLEFRPRTRGPASRTPTEGTGAPAGQ